MKPISNMLRANLSAALRQQFYSVIKVMPSRIYNTCTNHIAARELPIWRAFQNQDLYMFALGPFPAVEVLSAPCRWKPSPWSPFKDLLSKQQTVSCRSNLSRWDLKQLCASFTLGFVNKIMPFTASATISRCDSSRRYPAEHWCGCS